MYKCTVPTSKADVKIVFALGNFAWLLKGFLEKALNTVRKMKEEHESSEIERMLCSKESRTPLSKMTNDEIKKPIKRVGFGALLPDDKEEADSFYDVVK
ncbi:uncharacterized protein B0P05DRAFT_506535 [Gilbertella persicaria]|uniref:uncharacterized protein n=1 Tax=Gilbertella persicaria TaxID=101096 RepID=UPI0022201DD5|nr:uncharacterized protein B0P05DRAFT_506535 [Gilbertella persicaria]KAI8087039.1 hypothetical protein B0P05DRAFT_506535 [Gilbertella persicaria]